MDFLLYLEKYQPQLYVTSIIDHNVIKKRIPSSTPLIQSTNNNNNSNNNNNNNNNGNNQYSTRSNIHDLSYNNNFIQNNILRTLNSQFILSYDWSNFLKINLLNYIDKVFLFHISLIPKFKLHNLIKKSIKHLYYCYESYFINQFNIIGQYYSYFNYNNNQLNFLINIPNKNDCEKLCWAIRQPYLYKNGGLLLWGKKYRILYADYNQTLMAIEESGVNKINLSTFTATRLQIPNEEYLRSEEGLQFVMLIGFHRQDREQDKCNAAIMGVMDLLRKKLTSYEM
uniref:SIR2_2 domain-containing protein n=1 Tax=Schistosoma mansoni TaxID=6183 RepID=A0A5K4FCT6_SCHMA